jgi:hypothetical protein
MDGFETAVFTSQHVEGTVAGGGVDARRSLR